MNEQKRYAKLLRDIQGGKGLSKADQSFFLNYTEKADDTALQNIATSEGIENVDTLIAEGFKMLSSPENKERLLDLAEKSEKGQLATSIANALNIGLASFDIAQSQKQINASDRALRRSRRPQAPAALQESPELKAALADAQRGTYDAYRRLAPAQQQILDGYLSDLNAAETASTGQAGNYGALAQVAATRRGRRGQELVPLLDDVRAREQGRYDQLLGMKLNENQAIQQSQGQYYPYELQQYNNEQQLAGELGAMGRSNMRNSLANFGQQLPQQFADRIVSKRFDDLRSRASVYGDDTAEKVVQADRDMLFQQPYSPNYRKQLMKMYEAYGLPTYQDA